MGTRRATLIGVVALVALTVACGDDDDTSTAASTTTAAEEVTSTSGATTTTAPSGACALLSVDDIEAVLGVEVEPGEFEAMDNTTFCVFSTADETTRVEVLRADGERDVALAYAADPEAEPVDGLGDGAFLVGPSDAKQTVDVQQGDVSVGVTVEPTPEREDLLELATIALARL